MAEAAGAGDGDCGGEAERSPYELDFAMLTDSPLPVFGKGRGRGMKGVRVNVTNHCDGLDADHERVRRQVPRVGQGIFLPQLGKEVLRAGEARVVVDEVSLNDVPGQLCTSRRSIVFGCPS